MQKYFHCYRAIMFLIIDDAVVYIGPGRGATSTVCRCEQVGTNVFWAMKIINKKIDQKIVATEIGILLKLNHPNVIRLKEIYETETQIFLVLECVTGGELFDSQSVNTACKHYFEYSHDKMSVIDNKIAWNDTPTSASKAIRLLKNLHSGKADGFLKSNIQKPSGAWS
ncbi:hypothetical protein CAPTEDRAFT_196497 [Capitella teleta]|uniref:Protein kinase domain-containing protein n=1 Tax=Capitella teleta TaxID=283909 RepID=R7V4A5_CAPTE|nr:hypothetical protein CAPTEDRAFT_196497 [Capitella teleta]|eukprot:ELU13409.1 hypothetical protein CAPTEDRAFT_196497 [Capitella teleta]